ncbi:pentatricopeptide repeat-containing protein At4g32430, mitochondrial-like [Ananas comosus]|uniref:Pentatricopeptide repeat-containing protein At4g32430, mitochondrial-like n=1 Tax=Ananas comosus TaxID=4615 RepID=A0A199W2M2_ANACO|nr:pentatricopeptide repeat-containing protein At4g32430, mitochondrial-like [Ananas comosus]OAY83727.1 Pentatricopeptide repeat-containing protein, mitochondrial [Ananas comosus]
MRPLRPFRIPHSKSKPFSTAHHPFDETPQRTFALLLLRSGDPSAAAVAAARQVSAASAAADSPRRLHALLVASGLASSSTLVSNALINAYAKSGSLPLALALLAAAPRRDVASWNTALSGFTNGADALRFARRMARAGVRFDAVTFITALTFAADIRDTVFGLQLHSLALRSGFGADTFVGNAMITAYSRGGLLDDARRVFDEMLMRDLVSWNALICGYNQEGDSGFEAIRVFRRLVRESELRPDRISVASVIPACGLEGLIGFGSQIHCLAAQLGLEANVSVSNVLMSMYYKCGATDRARRVFENMVERDVISWTTMISMDSENAISLFTNMRLNGVRPNDVTFVALIFAVSTDWALKEGQMIHGIAFKTGISAEVNVSNSLITMYATLKCTEDSRKVFDGMLDREVVTWNALISGYAQNEQCEEALDTFSSLILHLKPNQYTFGSILSAITVAQTVSLTYGRMCHCYVIKLGLTTDEYVSGALIDMYAKRGSIDESQKAFDETINRSLIGWTAIISAHAKHGNYNEVMNLFEEMITSGINPDEVVVLAVLTACGCKGMVDMGRKIFDSMIIKRKVEPWPEHYACMVDMLGRAGRLLEAEELIKQMPEGPKVSALQSLLGACRVHGNVEIARRVAELLMGTEPSESGAYVLMSNIYAEKGEWENVAKIRKGMRERGVKKEVGFSWVDAGGTSDSLQLYKFSSDDMTHPMAEEIYRVADSLGFEMKLLESDVEMQVNSLFGR